jgi:putative transposase
MTTEKTVIEAWNKAVNNKVIGENLLFHSDPGVQYESNRFISILKYHRKATQSMSRKGNCWDNAVAESFFKTIKHEKWNRYKFGSIQEVRLVVFEYIERWYNRMRIHSSLGYKNPLQKEIELMTAKLNNVV